MTGACLDCVIGMWHGEPTMQGRKVKPIEGSWISILCNDRRHFYRNDACARFADSQWQAAVREVAELGMACLVVLSALGGRAFFDSSVAPKAKGLTCQDPIGAILRAADERGVKVFISSGSMGGLLNERSLRDTEVMRQRFTMMEEIVRLYGRHKSLHGWYWPDEPALRRFRSGPFGPMSRFLIGRARPMSRPRRWCGHLFPGPGSRSRPSRPSRM